MAGKDVLKALDPHIQAEETGSAMIVFADNSLGRVYLNLGILTSARYRSLEGMEALEACKTIGVKTVKFHAGTDIVRSRIMLDSNYEVIESLNQPVNAAVDPVLTAAPAPVVAAQPAAALNGPALTSTGRQQLSVLLTDYIGPIAPLVMSDLPRSVDIKTALSIVSREIDDSQRASEFVMTARQMLE